MTKVMLDEGVPRPLAARLRDLGADATAFPHEWKQISNGRLMDILEQQGFEVLITNDKNIPYQQNVARRTIAVLVLPTNHLRDILAMVSLVFAAIGSLEPGKSFLLDRSGCVSDYPPA